jgi:tyrosine-protein kinase Etk/Wzc
MIEADGKRVNDRVQVVSAEEEISLLDVSLVLARQKKLVMGLPIFACLAAVVVTFLLPNWYMATAKVLPPQQSQSSAIALLGQLGNLGGTAGQALGLKNPSDVYVAMLKSRSVADKLVERFDLRNIYGEELLSDARHELAKNSRITAGRDGVITIEVEDKNPERAADIANTYIEELRLLSSRLALTEASQRRLFFEGQLKKAKDDLTTAELDLKKFVQQEGLINPQGQISLSVSTAAGLRAQVAAREIQLSAMRTFATESNPEIKRILQEIIGLRGELAKMENDSNAGKGNVLVPFGKAPEVGMEYIRKFRETKYFETLFEVLAKQYEIARIDEARDAALIQVLDSAIPPEQKSSPKRMVITITAVLGAMLLAVVIALIRAGLARAANDSTRAQRLLELRRHLFLRAPD